MSDVVRVGKLEAARRQLQAAIRLMFEGGDPIVTHTLVGAASIVLSDLVEHRLPHKSWDRFAQEANNLKTKNYFNIMREAQNFLKHARDDPDGTLELNPTDTESLAFFATLNAGELLSHGGLGKLSMEESVFQLWYIACQAPAVEDAADLFEQALKVFGDLRGCSRTDRISAGKRVLNEYRE